jgi:hypothetical protein
MRFILILILILNSIELVPRIEDVEWRVDYVISSNVMKVSIQSNPIQSNPIHSPSDLMLLSLSSIKWKLTNFI